MQIRFILNSTECSLFNINTALKIFVKSSDRIKRDVHSAFLNYKFVPICTQKNSLFIKNEYLYANDRVFSIHLNTSDYGS